MKSLTCLAIFTFAFCLATAVRIKNCGGKANIDYQNIQITGCSPKLPYCIFEKNHTAQLSIPFSSNTEITSLKAVVHGVIGGIPIPFPLDNPEACGQSLTCPVAAHTNVTYFEGLPVKPIYPSLRLTVKWALQDQAGVDQVCILIPVKLQ
ncbi:NPC intracellular cholesterol transporter 2 homolog a [Hyalella azteca]|uniref:NPC intracellular cholesterol transporter 2 homolog a n=1 Tax=Hyalella azteca TaxID=294128 RepID=A0A8B7PIX4_HYAAZ|nr:NPC intracellular cholesterol transporter 2 homolog a [Hyalella azteca]